MRIKRLFDLIFSLIGLIILSPLFVLISILIKLTDRGPILFCQIRIGKNEQPFKIYKFRTMVSNAETTGLKLTVGKDLRITKIGHFLRKTKLDELPQLLNVLKGEMSLVGPRPEVPKYLVYYPADIKNKIFSVRPGITDLASLAMIDESSILAGSNNPEELYIKEILPQKLALSAKYVDSISMSLDFKIILKTLGKIITRSNI